MTNNNKIVPQGWQVKTLGEIGTFLKGKGIAKAEIVESGKPCIRYGQIYSEYNYFVEEFKSFIDETSAKNSEPIFKNDLLFAGSGETLTDIGKCVAYIKEEEAYAGGDIAILRPNSEDAHYLGYLFNADDFKKQTYKLGQGHSVVHIYSSSLKNVKVTLPPLPEQQKIAKILFTWDKAIKLQQQLIDNKKQYKKAVMKKLLTGEVRFKGFSEVWKVYKISSLGEISSGGTPDTNIATFWNGDINWCTPTEITALKNGKYLYNTKRKITEEGLKKSSATVLPINSLIICSRATIGDMAINKAPMSTNQGFKNIIPHIDVVEVDFLYYLLSINKNELLKRAIGSTFLEISKKDIGSIKLKMPQNTDEQLIIANYLNNIDKEIDILNNELVSFQKQKQGLMQQLLTGKIRVKN